MAKAFTPGLKVTGRTTLRVRRLLPIAGDVLAKSGDHVNARDVVARTFMPGDVTPVNVAKKLAVPPAEVPELMLVKVGDQVAEGQVIARSRGIFGMFKTELQSPAHGSIEVISEVTGQLMVRGEPLPVQVEAYISGTVIEELPGEGVVVQNDVALVQGIFGIGGEAHGRIRMAVADPAEKLVADHMKDSMRGEIVVGGGRLTAPAIRRAREIGVAAVIGGGIDDQDLRDFLGYDLGVAITGSEKVGLTVIITEGFGDISMAERTFQLLRHHEGHEASVNGATQIRAGVMRPELIIPLASGSDAKEAPPTIAAGVLEIGTPVRIIRDPHFGLIGAVASLPEQPHVLGSGSKARVLEVKLDSGESVVVPRANVELIEGS
ncbi:MAG: hypothetical protein KDA22_16950 [Phycisphaerales bacterium]|nr:hypothetical protein [Phycisphaerales bacterium]